jgi:hypothetical protein
MSANETAAAGEKNFHEEKERRCNGSGFQIKDIIEAKTHRGKKPLIKGKTLRDSAFQKWATKCLGWEPKPCAIVHFKSGQQNV